jgi:hypothetical protein
MPPQKANPQVTTKNGITRSKKVSITTMNNGKGRDVPKRKAERSPAKFSLKRYAFGDITNVSNISSYMN